MPRVLCMAGMAISILVFIVFLLDLVVPGDMAPFHKARPMFDIVFVICAAALGYLSWVTFREQD